MTASELQRILLYKGHGDMGDYLRNNPFNRCVYNVILHHGPRPLEVPMLTIFNETYYQCVRVNFDANPGTDLESRYLEEEANCLGSRKYALVVFSLVWGLMRCKDEATFNEGVFVDQFYPLMGTGRDERLAYILIKYTAGDRILPPKRFLPMPTPVDEIPVITGKEDCLAWREVTEEFTQKTIERYLGLYKTPEEQNTLLSFIEGAFAEVGDKGCRVNFAKLHEGILHGKYRSLAKEDAEYAEGMGLSYKEQLVTLQEKLRQQEEDYERRIRQLEGEHQFELNKLREQLEEKALKGRLKYDANAHLYTFTEMADIVKARFSKAGAEEFSNMLYKLASKHGYLDENTSRAIDDIVAAVLEREKGSTTVQIPTAHQVNINPSLVTNTFTDEEKTENK